MRSEAVDSGSKRIVVVKVGSGIIMQSNSELDYNRICILVQDIIALEDRGYTIVLVTGGAVAAGRTQKLVLKGVPKTQIDQLYFCVGQPKLVNFYSDVFQRHGKVTGQLLFSRDAFANRIQYFSIRDTIRNLINNDIVPIINDNDILHREESGFSDNDHLAACVGGMLNVDRVVFLTACEGIQRRMENGEWELIHEVSEDFRELDGNFDFGPGADADLSSKVTAAKLLIELGVESTVSSGLGANPISRIFDQPKCGTNFVPASSRKLSGIRKWLCTGAVPNGTIVVSPIGAEVIRNTTQRGSLLSRGIMRFSGNFLKGDVVCVCDEEGRLLGYGITKYSSTEIPALLGQEGIIVVHANYFYGTDRGYFR
jgi:glutamate 5-kinase